MMAPPTAPRLAMTHPDPPPLLEAKLGPGSSTRQSPPRPQLDPPPAMTGEATRTVITHRRHCAAAMPAPEGAG